MKPLLISFILLVSLSACDISSKADRTYFIAKEGILAASLSSKYALISSSTGAAKLWQLKPKTLLHSWQHTDDNPGIIHTAISGNEEYAMTAEHHSIAWWRISDGVLLNVWSLQDIRSLSLSTDGKFALIGLNDKAIYFSLMHGLTQYAFAHEAPVSATAISQSGKYAITGSEDRTAKLWELSTGNLVHTWNLKNTLEVVALSHNDQYALTNAALGQTKLWHTKSGKLYKQIGPNLMTLSSAIFSHDDKSLITGQLSQRIDQWDIKTGKQGHYWRPKKAVLWRPSAATILDFSETEDHKKLYTVASNGYIQRWLY